MSRGDEIALLMFGAAAGGIVNGLTGFGTGVTALPFWLFALTPFAATQLVAACSVAGQLTTLPAIIRDVDWRASAPMIMAGIAGIPVGAALSGVIDPAAFKTLVGVVVIVYAVLLLTLRRRGVGSGDDLRGTGPALVPLGLAAGFLSGLAGLSGVLPTVWALWHGWSKQRSRAFFQGFNLPVLAATLLLHVLIHGPAGGLIAAFVLALPATIAGALLGQAIYRRIPTPMFQAVVLILLVVSGATLIAAASLAPSAPP